EEPVSIALGKVLDRSGYLQDLRDERSEEAEGRIENLLELVSAAREYESRNTEPSLGGFVDQLSLLSDVDEEAGAKNARGVMLTMHSAKGLEFPIVVISGLEEGLFPHSRSSDDETELEEERRLCYVAITRAQRRLVLTSAARRRVFGDYQSTEPSRFVDEIPAELIGVVPSSFSSSSLTPPPSYPQFRDARKGGSYRGRTREEPEVYSYEDEDQSLPGEMKLGAEVRHPKFGVGTILSVEPLDDDTKLVVRFLSVGQKTLRARFAKLEMACLLFSGSSRTALLARRGLRHYVANRFVALCLFVLLLEPCDRNRAIVALDVDESHTLSGATNRADGIGSHPQDLALLGNQHQLVVVAD